MKKRITGLALLIALLSFNLIRNHWNNHLSNSISQPTISQTQTNSIYPQWSYSQYPEYVTQNGPAQIDTSQFPTAGSITYTGKDSLGRTQAVYGTITFDMVQKSSFEERPDFKKGDNPSGWNKNSKATVKTSTGTYSGWFWNRSHLIADRLGGEATSNNAITGTRMQNVGSRKQTGGMYYIEELTVDYLRNHKSNHVYYSATPIYQENELIPRYVIVNALSDDNTLNAQYITFNTQNGYTINYNNGSYTKN